MPSDTNTGSDTDHGEAQGAIGIETVGMTMRFGAFTALDEVSMRVRPGTFHALLGENGAGKSTLVKCVMGYNTPTTGELMVDGRQVAISDPRAAHALGLGMVYQHFTLVPSLTAAENLVIARPETTAVIDWYGESCRLAAFMAKMPFQVPLDRPVRSLAAGERQKLELLKQLYLGRRFLILDEPTSVLTPAEADELLRMVRDLTQAGTLTALVITHKFREVNAFADEVTVLRRGRHVGGGARGALSQADMARLMVGERDLAQQEARTATQGAEALVIAGAKAPDRSGLKTIQIERLTVRSGEIVGVAGVSGNGQMELMELLTGQRELRAGAITVNDAPYHATRREAHRLGIRYLPEEPLRNACAAKMSVVENIAFRTFDLTDAGTPRFWLAGGAMWRLAQELIDHFRIKAPAPQGPISALSGGNVQRAVLARELTGDINVLVVSNPCFGLDFTAVAEIRARLVAARNAGAAVLLISEDLDEILELSDRVLVMSEGQIVYETLAADADMASIGHHMAGHA